MDELVLSAWTALTVLAFQLDVVTGLVLTTFLVAYLAFSLNVWAQKKKPQMVRTTIHTPSTVRGKDNFNNSLIDVT